MTVSPTDQSGARPPEQVPPTGPQTPETAGARPAEVAPAAPDPLTKNFQEELSKKRERHEDLINEQKKKFKLTGTIGKTEVEMITDRQINKLRDLARDKEVQFGEMLAAQKAARLTEILGSAEQEMTAITDPYMKIIDYVRGLDRVDERELARLDALMESMSKLKTNPELEKIFLKALNKSTLTAKDLEFLVNSINPVEIQPDLRGASTQSAQLFEAGQVGAVLSVLKDSPQFMTLLELIIRTKSPEQTRQILESLLTAGVMSTTQLKNLLDRNILTGQTATDLKQALENGDLAKKQQAYEQQLEQMAIQNKGRTAENPASKAVSAPVVMAAAGLLGIATALANLKVGWNKDNTFMENLADAATNPYIVIGTAAAIGGVVAMGPVVAPETFGKYKDKFLDFWKGPEERREDINIDQARFRQMLDGELIKNPFLLAFLERKEAFPGGQELTGLEIIKKLVEEKRMQNKDVTFNFREIMARSGGQQKELLSKAYAQGGGKDVNFEDSLRGVMAALTQLKMDNTAGVSQIARDIAAKQGIK